MIPIISINAIVEQPLKFIGDMIFANGDNDVIDKDIEELYHILLKTELGEEATFMHIKYDYYNHTNVFKPGYNVQIGVNNGYIAFNF